MLSDMRNKAGLSQPKLAEKSGVNVRMIQFYEQGAKDINGAKLKTLAKLAKALDCSIAEILTDESLIEEIKGLKLV